MGLAGVKKKLKISKDPNNTHWARNTDSFGQKMLCAQGWKPGQCLGAKNAPHAAYHAQASFSYVRVILKDDMLGIGASRNTNECTGLNAFQDLLGRLNGQSQEKLESKQKARDDVRRKLLTQQKYGTMVFVHGGWLVGNEVRGQLGKNDGISDSWNSRRVGVEGSKREKNAADETTMQDRAAKDERSNKVEVEDSRSKASGDGGEECGKERKSKKRKADERELGERQDEDVRDKIRKKKRKEEKDPEPSDDGESPQNPIEKKKKKKKKKKKERQEKEKKKEKRGRKGKLKSQKKTREDEKGFGEDGQTEEVRMDEKKRRKRGGESPPIASTTPKIDPESLAPKFTSTDAPSAGVQASKALSSTPSLAAPVRNISRRRFIEQKRLALTDPKALQQIFMIKS